MSNEYHKTYINANWYIKFLIRLDQSKSTTLNCRDKRNGRAKRITKIKTYNLTLTFCARVIWQNIQIINDNFKFTFLKE